MATARAGFIEKRKRENAEAEAVAEAAFAVRMRQRATEEAAQIAAGAAVCREVGCGHVARKSGLCLGHQVL